ncbi:hypothetical protein [Klebsiella pneumoniae]|uniref:hypothetical protein n=1 Tax=Klebsiella pneumoniae TaxID=573 RepID=UPI000E2C60F3|nr:hypothetical protein [Klebsiella pneumoniae]SXQ32488.1 Uncharacterised protein [Klebsiella pneumoniae]
MNISTVNELIQSLESAGELSIREQKFLKLAKAYQQLAAENVGLKAAFEQPQAYLSWHAIPPTWNDPLPCGEYLDVHDTDGHKNSDGTDCWPVYAKPEIETPATDRIVAGIKADGVTAALESCSDYLDTDCVMDRLDISYEDAEKRTSGAIEFHDAMVNFASQLREEADK